jgi:hypothetical protein
MVQLRVYQYTSVCCNANSKKPPCERSKEDRREAKFSQSGLGKWKCENCRKACKVERNRRGNAEQAENRA